MTDRVLVVDDESLLRRSLSHALSAAGFLVDEAIDGAEAVDRMRHETYDLVLLDQRLPDRTGVEVLRLAAELHPNLPVVMITGDATLRGAVEAVKEGAYDYLSKPFDLDHVLQIAARAIETGRLRREVAHQKARAFQAAGAHAVVAVSPAMRGVLDVVDRIARSEASTILLLGESGVGKGLVARLLHSASEGARGPFMNITCTALSPTLLESELFGHEKGAFTDARMQKRGLFELADGGTLFLDEIGDISASLQSKLIRFLEEKTFRRVGGTRDIGVSLRIVAATNKDLHAEVENGNFRSDLYYRLRVIPVTIPPLRDRREDVEPLAVRFIDHFNGEFRKRVRGFDEAAMRCMTEYPWPGNVRELRNAVERAVLLSDTETLGVRDLPDEVRRRDVPATADLADLRGFVLPRSGVALEEVERTLIEQALERSNGNRTRAASLLGLNRDQVRYRIEKFGLNGWAVHR